MNAKKCIYCGRDADLSKSDIMPDGLTNSRIFNENVCRIEHNNKFSDLFESKVINDFAYITNQLDIKSSKAKKYHEYEAEVEINHDIYSVKTDSSASLFRKRTLKSLDGKRVLTTKSSGSADNRGAFIIDINNEKIIKKVKISADIFFSKEIFRLMAKIAYEWYCFENDISGYHSEFDEIIRCITNGEALDRVSVVAKEDLYTSDFSIFNSYGNHHMILFDDTWGRINAWIYFFEIAFYRVILTKKAPANCKYNFLYRQLSTYGDNNISIKKTCLADAARSSNFEVERFIDELNETVPEQICKSGPLNAQVYIGSHEEERLFRVMGILAFCSKVDLLSEAKYCISNESPNEKKKILIPLIFNNLSRVLLHTCVSKRKIRRFVKDHFRSDEPIRLNFSASNPNFIFLLYIVMQIGIMNLSQYDRDKVEDIVRNKLHKNIQGEYFLDEELEQILKQEISSVPNYDDIIRRGISLVKAWG